MEMQLEMKARMVAMKGELQVRWLNEVPDLHSPVPRSPLLAHCLGLVAGSENGKRVDWECLGGYVGVAGLSSGLGFCSGVACLGSVKAWFGLG